MPTENRQVWSSSCLHTFSAPTKGKGDSFRFVSIRFVSLRSALYSPARSREIKGSADREKQGLG